MYQDKRSRQVRAGRKNLSAVTSVLMCTPFCKHIAEDGPKKGPKRSNLNKED